MKKQELAELAELMEQLSAPEEPTAEDSARQKLTEDWWQLCTHEPAERKILSLLIATGRAAALLAADNEGQPREATYDKLWGDIVRTANAAFCAIDPDNLGTRASGTITSAAMSIEQMAMFEQLQHELLQIVQDRDAELATEALLSAAYELNGSCEIINKILQQWEAAEFPALSVMLKFGIIEKYIGEDGEERIRPKNDRAIAYMKASVAHVWDSDAGRAIKAAAAQLREKKPRLR